MGQIYGSGVIKPGDLIFPLSPPLRGEGWGEGEVNDVTVLIQSRTQGEVCQFVMSWFSPSPPSAPSAPRE
jgi:hypothetical protein